MVFRDYTYSILVISGNKSFSDKIASMLPASEYWPVTFSGTAGEGRRMLLERAYDIVIINSPLSDESGIRIAEDIDPENGTGILIFVKSDKYDDVYARVYEKGVMVLPKPTSMQMVSQTLRLMCTVKERMKRMEERQATVEDKIREIRIVNRAKWLLIEKENMSEKEAHAFVEHLAMDERISKKKAAESIIHQFSD